MHQWIRATASDFTGTLPLPRSGHTAVNIGKSMIVIFGGFADKRFLSDIVVYDIENKLWFQPECTGGESDGHVGPSSRAFHVSVSIDCHMFVFGGRSGSKRLGDFWVLDTDIWQWSELTGFGDLPSPRDFAAASAIGNRKIVLYGGWDGKKWMSDVYVLDTISLEWMELAVAGTVPAPRCGHTATMLEKRLLVYGGRGGGGPIMGDLWALKGLIEEENEEPGWTQLKLPGQAPSPRCGHTVTFGGHNLLMFGGHGTGGWLSRYDVYYNDCVILDRVSVQWKRLPTSNEPPPARAYHSMTCIGSRYLLFGGFDGKTTYGDLWWLVPEDDPIAKRYAAASEQIPPESKNLQGGNSNDKVAVQEREGSAILELERKLNIPTSNPSSGSQSVNEVDDKELLELAYEIIGDSGAVNEQVSHLQAIQALRDYWRTSDARSVPMKQLGPLFRDYKRLIARCHIGNHNSGNSSFGLLSIQSGCSGQEVYHFYHIRNASQLRMVDIPRLLEEYKQLPCS